MDFFRSNPVKTFGDTAVRLSRSPLGIIALFIVLVYGIAALVTAASSTLTAVERLPLVYFLVFFPVAVLGLFGWIAINRPGNLFSPQDFRDEENYVTLVASLTAANARKPAAGSQETAVDVQKIVRTARSLVPAATEARSTRNDVLWVDDHPENNVYERKAFETLGITVSIALSTEQALKLIQSESFGAIISDMGRKEGPKEGYKLLDNLRKQKDKTPFFIYAGSNAQAHKREAAKHGAQGSTNDPNELLQMVTTTIWGNYAPPYRG